MWLRRFRRSVSAENFEHSTLNIERRRVKVPTTFHDVRWKFDVECSMFDVEVLIYDWSGNLGGRQLRLDWRGFWAENAFFRRDGLIWQARRGDLGRQ